MRRPGSVVVELAGALDHAGRVSLEPALAEIDLSGAALVVDLTRVDFLDCAGLTLLVDLRERCAGTPTLIAPRPEHRRLLKLTGLDRAFRVRDRAPRLPLLWRRRERGRTGRVGRPGRAGALPAAALAAVTALGVADLAVAHSGLQSTAPREGAVLKHLPRTLTLSFNTPVLRVGSVEVVRAGRDAVAGEPRRDPSDARKVVARLRGDAPGVYRVTWSVVGQDGHEVQGRFSFRVAREEARTAEAPASLGPLGGGMRRMSDR